ncbi:Stalked cell differentiation-controlling protein [Variovorax sp. PBL-E5]|nr:Stalked cell differentiation-controlling protein [Variovorax sp. PBL-E5]
MVTHFFLTPPAMPDNRRMDAQQSSEPSASAPLDEARRLLEGGEVEAARSLAVSVLKTAEDLGDRSMQARALMALAQYDRVLGQFRRAIATAQRAVQLSQLDGDISSEASALSLFAHASSILGRDAEAVEAALLSVKLGELLSPGPHQVNLHNYLGVTYLWSKSFTKAEASLRESERLALLYAPVSNVLLPRTNLAWLEVMRLSSERYFTGVMPSTATLRQRLADCSDLFEEGSPFPMLPGVRSVLQRFARSSLALCLCWEGRLDAAEQEWIAAEDRAQPAKYAQVANVISHWVRAELHWGRQDMEGAQREAAVLIELAGDAEFEQMANVGHLLLTQIFKAQGQYARALEEEGAHRRRELRVRSEILDSRHGVVQTHLDIRTSEQHLRLLAQHSQELERLSFEDSLTGIPNRRSFDVALAQALKNESNSKQPLCLALIDLNDFKCVNDTYSHAAGDDVLKTVADAIRASVRQTDLPARLGGDEFVVLFPHTTVEAAQSLCRQIHSKMAALRWDHWSPELRVTVSIGVALAEAEDTPEMLFRRSDRKMFEAKAALEA